MGDDWTEFVHAGQLICKVELSEHFAESSELDNHHVDDILAMLASHALPDDEWWKWIEGTEPLRQMGGLALVRKGEIVWAWLEWIS